MSLASELKRLVGWGLLRHCHTCRILRGLVLERHPGDWTKPELSQLTRGEVQEAARKLGEAREKACLVLLRLSNESTTNATLNREAAIRHLGLYISPETFRRPFGPEWELMVDLAVALEKPDLVAA